MNEPFKLLNKIPCDRGEFEVREVFLRHGVALQLYYTGPDGRVFSRFIFDFQVAAVRDAIDMFLANRLSELEPTTPDWKYNEDE